MADRTVASAAADLRLVDTKIPSDIAAAKRKLLAELRKIEQEAKIKVGVSFDAATANRDLARFRAALKDVNIQLGVDAKAAIAELQTFNAAVQEADADDINVRVGLDGAVEATGQLQLFGALADEVDGDDINVRMDVDGGAEAVAQITAVKTAARDVRNQERSGAGLAGAFAGLAGLVAPVALVGVAIGGIGAAISTFGVKASADLEQTIKAFENILGSAEKAQELFGELQDLADISPFETQTLANSAKSLLAIGVATEDIIPTVNNLAGIVSLLGGASADSFGRLNLALGQIRSSMKPMTVDLYQVQNALPGFNAKLQLATGIAEEFGITNEEAAKKIEDGAITGEQAYDILLKRMAEFPGAATAIAAQADTLQGKLSTFTDTIKRSLVESFLPVTQLIKDSLPDLTVATQSALEDIAPALARSFEKLLPAINPLIETLGESLAPAFEGVFTSLGTAIEGITPILQELGPIVGDIFPILGEIVATLGPAVADAAGALGGALVPAFQAFADVLNAIPTPVLTIVVEAIIAMSVASKVVGGVEALAGAIQALGKASTVASASTLLIAGAITALLLIMGDRAKREQEVRDRTNEVSDALATNTEELLSNTAAMQGARTEAGATALAYGALGDAIGQTGEDGEKLTLALNNIGLDTSAQNIVTVLDQIGAFGDPQGDVARVPGIMDALTASFGDQADFVARSISSIDLYESIISRVENTVGDLTPAQKGLIRSIEELQDQSEKTDLAPMVTGLLQSEAASGPLQEALLKLAEETTGFSRFTTDADEALALFGETIRRNGVELGGEQNRFSELRGEVEQLPPAYGSVEEAVADLGRITEEEMAKSELAIQGVKDALNNLLAVFDADVAAQNFKANLQELPAEFADVVTLVKQQAKDNGINLFDFLVSGDTDAARVAFQELVGPLVRDGKTAVENALALEGPDAAIQIAQTTRLQIIDALTRAGLDQGTAIALAESYVPTSEIERLIAQSGADGAAVFVSEIEEGTEGITIGVGVNADTAEAKIAIQGLSNEQVNVLVGADVSAALNAIESLSGRTAFINIQTSVQGDPELGRLERQLNRDLNGNGVIGRKDGGLVEFFRNGGFAGPLAREEHYAQIVPAGTWRVFAEPETGGEAYIPMGRNKRARSEKILSTVADLFGMDLVPRPSAAAVARAAHGFGDDPRAGGVGVLTREDVRTMARDIAEEVVAAMPAPVTVEHHPSGYSDPNAMAEIIYAKINRKVRRR